MTAQVPATPCTSPTSCPGSGSGILRGAAEAIAASLIDGSTLEVSRLRQLRDALLTENPDASDDAARRCAEIRAGFAVALRDAVRERPMAASLVVGGVVPQVRVEVRQTAGRLITHEAFIVGRAAECDVQTSGDATVSRLQFVVVSLPGGIVVADAWSSGGTRVVQRSGLAKSLPASVPGKRAAFILPHGEQVILLIGKQTTVTLGPVAGVEATTAALVDVGAPIDGATAPTQTTVQTAHTLQPPAPVAAATSMATDVDDPFTHGGLACDNNVAAAPVASSPTASVAALATTTTPPINGMQGGLGLVGQTPAEIACAAAASATPPAQETESGLAPSEALPPRTTNRAWAALSRCLTVVRAGVRMQHASSARARLRWRCRMAKRARLLSPEQCDELEERLRPHADIPGDGLNEVGDVLDGLGVPPAPDDPAPTFAAAWECPVCRTMHRTCGWRCPFQHRFCRGCMVQWADAIALPSCPHEGCGYRLSENDLENLRVTGIRLDAFRSLRAQEGIAALLEPSGPQVTVFRCPGTNCSAAVVSGAGEDRRRFVCSCGAPPVCTGCGTSPYHSHALCSEVQPLRARWLAWLQGGREVYHRLQQRANREANAQQKALRLEGPRAEAGRVQTAPALSRAGAISGRGVRHLFAQCNLCTTGGQCIIGPRFRCIHCQSFNCCLKCEPRLATEHAEGHVFEILFEDELNWASADVVLPKGTRARIRRRTCGVGTMLGAAAEDQGAAVITSIDGTGRKRRGQDAGLEGAVKGQKHGKYVLELTGGLGTRHVAAVDIQPLLTKKQAEHLLAASSIGGGATLNLKKH